MSRINLRSFRACLAVAFAIAFAAPALADWVPSDGHKMHYPQLPNPNGWDVNFTWPKILADDWQCSQTGPVSDIHFWFSAQQDQLQPPLITSIHASIHSDVPAGATGGYSHPGDLLWQRDFLPEQFIVAGPFSGVEGWYDPNTGLFNYPDHFQYGQVNITKIVDPFIQERGTIYWLDLSVMYEGSLKLGWKTSLQHFNDDAVWSDAGLTQWQELRDPITGESLDLAFVITPEPASAILMVVGGLTLIFRRASQRA